MRRSSWLALAIAGLLLAVLVAVLVLAGSRTAPPMSQREASRIINQGIHALEQRDVGAIMALFTPDARILEHKADEVRPLIEKAVTEISGPFKVSYRKVSVQQSGTHAEV